MDERTLYERLAGWGAAFSPAMIEGTQALFAPLVPRPDEAQVVRDLAYGPHERHRLDLFCPAGVQGAPVLLFVHGGGFVMGDKGPPEAAFHNNIGAWAMRHGVLGATMSYRLAPQHGWPAGRDDVIAAVRWLAAHVHEHGGDAGKIFIMGQSAGATHVADAAAAASEAGIALAGAAMISGIYDVTQAEENDFQKAYYGADRAAYAARSSLRGLVDSSLPLLFSVSEFDPPDFQRQALLLVQNFVAAHGSWPRMHWLAGHNHLSSVSQIGSMHDTLGPLLVRFME